MDNEKDDAEHLGSSDCSSFWLDSIRSMPIVWEDLELLPKPCHDCAVTTGFYREYSDAYKDMPPEEQLARSKQWFCHNACNRACRGHANNIGVSW